MVKALPIDLIWRKRVIRSKNVREEWMKDNGLSNVMELIKRQKWESLFKRRKLIHMDVDKEFYARMTVIHLKKKDVVKSSVKGVAIEFDHLKLASILGIPGNNRICEYIKDVWEESKYIKPLEITRRFANNETLKAARRVKSSEEPKRYDYFEETFLTMCKLTRENGVWWIGTGENRRRDEEVDAPEEKAEEEVEAQKDFDWEAVIDEAAVQGESRSDDQFFYAQVDVEEPVTETPAAPVFPASPGDSSTQQKEQTLAAVDPSGPSGHIPEAVMNKLQAEFERTRANRFQVDLEKAQAENARLLALLQQA
ncbi:hypothetical protein Dimus_018693 [Dionaea muscipula]